MRVAPSQESEDSGIRHVQNYFRDQLHWIFRVQREFDFGVDAHAEIVIPPERITTNQLLSIQVKSGDSYFRSSHGQEGWKFSHSNDRLAYWLGGSLPTIVILVNSRCEAYWQVVSARTVTENAEGFWVLVPRAQPLDATARDTLIALARQADGLIEQFPRHLAVFSPAVTELLESIGLEDHLGAARLAEYLAGDGGSPALATDAMISA
jgi:hypothetical protein